MQNMGTWNSTMALVFGCFFTFPFLLLILSEIVAKLPQPKTVTKVKYVQLPTKIEYVKVKPEIIHKTKWVYKNNTPLKKKPKIPISAPTESLLITRQILTDAISALRGIGIGKADATNLVNLKYDPAKHSDFEHLFRDCMNN